MGKQRDSMVLHSAYKNAASYSANSTSMGPLHQNGNDNGNAVSKEVELCEEQKKKVYECLDDEGSEEEKLQQKDSTAEQNGELTQDDLSEGSIALSSSESDNEDQHWLTFLQSLAEKKKRRMLRILHFANRFSARKQSAPVVPHSPYKCDSDDATAVARTATTRFERSANVAEQSAFVDLCQLHEEEPKEVEKQCDKLSRKQENPDKEGKPSEVLKKALTKSARSSSEKKRRSVNALDTPEKKRLKQDTGEIIWKDPEKSGSSGKRKPADGVDAANKRRKIGGIINDTQLKMLGPLKLPELAKGLVAASESDPQVRKLNSQLLDINRKLNSQEAIDDLADDELSPSPPPVYDGLGIRVNTRGARLRRKLADRRQKIVSDLVRTDPMFEAPKEYKPRKLYRKLYIPVKEYPWYNFTGLIIGPRGCTRRRLEKETGARITLRGRGTCKQRKGAKAESWEDEDLHVYIEAASEESVDAAVRMVEKVLVPVQEGRNEEEIADVNFARGEDCDRSAKAEFVDPAKLFVCYLPRTVDDARLRVLFVPFGPLCESVVVKDKITGSSKGYGFVKYTSPRFAAEAVARMNGYRIDGKVLLVRVAGRVPSATGVARKPRGRENIRPVDPRVPQCQRSVGPQYQTCQLKPSCGLFPLQHLRYRPPQFPFVQQQALL